MGCPPALEAGCPGFGHSVINSHGERIAAQCGRSGVANTTDAQRGGTRLDFWRDLSPHLHSHLQQVGVSVSEQRLWQECRPDLVSTVTRWSRKPL